MIFNVLVWISMIFNVLGWISNECLLGDHLGALWSHFGDVGMPIILKTFAFLKRFAQGGTSMVWDGFSMIFIVSGWIFNDFQCFGMDFQ